MAQDNLELLAKTLQSNTDAMTMLLQQLASGTNLENKTGSSKSEPLCGKDSTMKKIRRPYVIGGQQVWLAGISEQDIADKYAEALFLSRGLGRVQDVVGHSLCDMLDRWFEHKKSHDKIKQNTANNYDTHVRSIKEHFAGKDVEDIRWVDLQVFFDKFSDKAKSTVWHKKVILSQVFQWAVDDGVISVNPARDSRLAISKTTTKRQPVPFELYQKICKEIPKIAQARDRALMALIAFSGMRRGEILALRWEDIDWTSGVINVSKAVAFVGNAATLKAPKSEAGVRQCPVIQQLRDILFPIRADSGIVVSKDGITSYTETAYTRAWERITSQIDMKGHTAHSFRHSVASIYAASADVTPKTLQTLMGHSDISTTMNVYAKTEIQTLVNAGRIFTRDLSVLATTCKDNCTDENPNRVDVQEKITG
ncbi:MAG: site-specific integrase [Candidatus Sumerlaeales bacterium]|nr:site-specific integrase [Candidatus Sumerlaeales bacterium]